MQCVYIVQEVDPEDFCEIHRILGVFSTPENVKTFCGNFYIDAKFECVSDGNIAAHKQEYIIVHSGKKIPDNANNDKQTIITAQYVDFPQCVNQHLYV